ncbi:MAG: Trk system potassium transporter TrkA [Lachnospiraceae bacterium]|nr:Trk system potassium transporter TrkA [Lachnospiraceae bacterium]
MFEKFRKSKTAKQGLSIIIVGCGKVGATLAEQLCKEGHDIAVVDKNPARVQALTDLYDVMGLVGNGASYNVQIEAGIEKADLIISVTDSDELNLLTCTVAKRVGNCAAIARVRNPDYSEEVSYLQERLELAMIINPEREAANEIARILYLPAALSVNPFARGQAEMVRIKIPEGNVLNGQSLAVLGRNIARDILVCAVERGEKVLIPDGNFELYSGDVVSFIASAKEATEFLEKIGIETGRVSDVLMIGGGKSSYYLAKQLLDVGIGVKIIESRKERCEELSVLLPKAVIINGDGTKEELLKEEGIEETEAFVPLTGIDEENILLTLHAREVSDAKVITKINRITFHNVISHLELGSVVYPKYITAEAIIAYVRALTASLNSNIETLYHIIDHRAEAIEFRVTKESALTGKTLRELSLKENLLIACINRNGLIIIPGGEDCILPGDTVVIVTTHTGFNDIEDILR